MCTPPPDAAIGASIGSGFRLFTNLVISGGGVHTISEISEIYNALIDGGHYRRVGVEVQHEIRWRGLRLSY